MIKNLRDALNEVLTEASQSQAVIISRDKKGQVSFLTFQCPTNIEVGGLLNYASEYTRFQIQNELKGIKN